MIQRTKLEGKKRKWKQKRARGKGEETAGAGRKEEGVENIGPLKEFYFIGRINKEETNSN